MKRASFSSLALAIFLILASLSSSRAVTLLPQEQAIANYLTTNPGQGRPYMVLDPLIVTVARARAKDMAVRNYFSHVNPNGVAANFLLRQAGYQLPAWWGTVPSANYVESIAAGYASPSQTWTAWMNSPPHKTHLLAENSFFATETHYGVGFYYDPNSTFKYYWVVITAPPQPIEVVDPAPSSQVTSSTLPVDGTTDPSVGAASVQFRIENTTGTDAWTAANGVTTWSGTATGLVPGYNLIRAQALDSYGDVLAENTSAFTYVVVGTLTVTTSGSGAVTTAYNGVTTQDVGEPITVSAYPAAGSLFTGWTGSVTSSSPSITFSMVDGDAIQANFAPNPFPAVSGIYYGALATGSGQQTGLVALALAPSGHFSGRLIFSGGSWSIAGYLDITGSTTITIPVPGQSPMTLSLQADLTGGSGQITGLLTAGGQTYGLTVSESTFSPAKNPAPQAGHYTLVLPSDPTVTGSSGPQGSGFATLMVNSAGDAVVAGALADGTPFSAGGHVANDGTLALYAVPRGAPAGSSLNGLLTFRSTSVSDVDGSIWWTQGANPKSIYYPAGFVIQSPAVGSIFARSAVGLEYPALIGGADIATMGGGDLPQTLTVPVVVTPADKAVMVTAGQPYLALGINRVSGVVLGGFLAPDGTGYVVRRLAGVLLQKQNSAFGFFPGTDQFGSFALTPGP